MSNSEERSRSGKCDICGVENDTVIAGRWIFHCPEHEQEDFKLAYENEIEPLLDSGEVGDVDGELAEYIEKYL